MASPTVIIFGPTGNIGSVAARTAHDLGAKVILAMRDTKKTIPGLSPEDEEAGRYQRVQADLMDPASISEAVRKTGAKRAYFYLAHGAQDGMKGTVQALKDAGIEFAVFLSSYTLIKELKDIEPHDIIPYIHAQVELNLQAIFGKDNYVGIRPGAFATNTLWWAHGVKDGDVKLPYPEAYFDYITPLDMGRVSGNVLVKGKHGDEHYVYLFGPQIWKQDEAVQTLSKALNKDLKITPLYGEPAVELYSNFAPEMLAKYLIKKYGDIIAGHDSQTEMPWFKEGQANIEKYSGHKAQTYDDWVKNNTQLFTG